MSGIVIRDSVSVLSYSINWSFFAGWFLVCKLSCAQRKKTVHSVYSDNPECSINFHIASLPNADVQS